MRAITSSINSPGFLFGVLALSLIALVESRSAAAADTANLWIQVFGPFSGQVAAGETFSYEYNIRNDGPGVSEDVTLRDFFPPEIEFVKAVVDAEGSLGLVPLGCDVLGNNVLWCPLGDIEPTGTVPIFVFATVRLKEDVQDGAVIINDANVDLHDTQDPDISNNKDYVSLTATAQRQRSP